MRSSQKRKPSRLKVRFLPRSPFFPMKAHFSRAQSYSNLSGSDVNSDHLQVVPGGFESLLGVMVGNKSGVIIKGCIALAAETIKDDQQTSMFLVDVGPHKIDDGDVVPRLTSRTESMAEHEPPRSLQPCFPPFPNTHLLP